MTSVKSNLAKGRITVVIPRGGKRIYPIFTPMFYTWFLGPMSQPPNGILIGSAVFAKLTHVNNTQTDTQCPATSVATGCIW